MSDEKKPRRAEACVWDDAIDVVQKHKRHIKRSPGVGPERQQYALACLDDVLSDLNAKRTASFGAE